MKTILCFGDSPPLAVAQARVPKSPGMSQEKSLLLGRLQGRFPLHNTCQLNSLEFQIFREMAGA